MLECTENWICVKILGSGSFGDVTLWEHVANKTLVAVKTCRANLPDMNKEQRLKLLQRWNKEVEIMSMIDHENLVHACPEQCQDLLCAINSEVDTHLPAIAMEFCEAGSLRDKLKEKANINGLSEFDVREVLRALTNGLKYLHGIHQITHRDIKPDNIMLKARSDGKIIYKLTDVGFARDIAAKTIDASMVGTQNYFAPEMVINAAYKNTVDYWSVGVVAFEIICGTHPFLPGESICEVIAAIERKDVDCIAITKDSGKALTYHNELPAETRLSGTFARLIVPWLRLALDKCGHVRGCDTNGALSFYTLLQTILDTKVLTIFWINKCRFLSYNLAEFQTIQQLYERLNHTTGTAEFQLFLPEGRDCSQMAANSIQSLYDEQFLEGDKPMMYLMTFNEGTLCNPDEPFVPATILRLVSGSDESVNRAVLQQSLLNTLYMHQNEERKCHHLLTGLNDFAMNLEDALVKLTPMVCRVKDEILEYHGQVSQFESMLTVGTQEFPGGSLNSMLEDNAKHMKTQFAEYGNIWNSLDSTRARIRKLIHQGHHCETALAKIKHLIENLNHSPCRGPSATIIDMIRTDAVALITARKEFVDTVKTWLTDTTVGETTCDILKMMWNEYMRIGGLLKDHRKRFNDARMKVENMTKDYMEQFTRPKEKPISLEFQTLVKQMETLDVSRCSNDDLIHENDMYQKYISDTLGIPMDD